MPADPLSLSKEDYTELMDQISLQDSPVGIDAKYTHAIIITYLQRISDQLKQIDSRLSVLENSENSA